MKPRFRKGQVVAFRGADGHWGHDRIASINPPGRPYENTAWMLRSCCRMRLKNLRPLTARECGPRTRRRK